MRNLSTALAAAGLLLACVDGAAPPSDGEDESALGDGKGDGASTYSACQLDAVVTWLNHGADVEDLDVVFIDPDAAMSLATRRHGPDGVSGTADDRPLRDAYEVGAVPYVGPRTFDQLVRAGAKICADPALEARDASVPAEMDVVHPFAYFRPGAEPNGDCALPTRAHLDSMIARCTARTATTQNFTDRDDCAWTALARYSITTVSVTAKPSRSPETFLVAASSAARTQARA